MLEKQRRKVISGSCKSDDEELWNCAITATLLTKKGNSEVAVSTLQFGVKRKTWELVPEFFNCY